MGLGNGLVPSNTKPLPESMYWPIHMASLGQCAWCHVVPCHPLPQSGSHIFYQPSHYHTVNSNLLQLQVITWSITLQWRHNNLTWYQSQIFLINATWPNEWYSTDKRTAYCSFIEVHWVVTIWASTSKWKSKVKVIAQGHKEGITLYRLISYSIHVHRPSHSWDTAI